MPFCAGPYSMEFRRCDRYQDQTKYVRVSFRRVRGEEGIGEHKSDVTHQWHWWGEALDGPTCWDVEGVPAAWALRCEDVDVARFVDLEEGGWDVVD